jgi:hypothetical protein
LRGMDAETAPAPHGLDNFYKKIGVNALFLKKPLFAGLQIPK